MILKSVKIRNFRAIGSLDLELHPRLNVIFGENGAGKTSLLDAIYCGWLWYADGVLRRGADVQTHDRRRVKSGRTTFHGVALTTTAGEHWKTVTFDDSDEARHCVDEAFGSDKDVPDVQEEMIRCVREWKGGRLSTPLPALMVYPADRRIVYWNAYPTARNRFIPISIAPWPQQMTSSFDLFSHAMSVTQPAPEPRDAKDNLLVDTLLPNADFNDLVEWLQAAESEEFRRQRDDNPIWKSPAAEAVRGAVETTIPGASRLRVSADHELYVNMSAPDGQESTLSMRDLSGGYRTLLSLVADLARRLAILSPSLGTQAEAVVLIDEIDLHLHPRWQQTVLEDMLRAFPNVQFIVTTHSEQVVASVEPQHLVGLDFDPNSGVKASRPNSSYGATPDRATEIMGVPTGRQLRMQQELDAYWALIQAGQGEAMPARELRARLDGWFRGEDPEMVRADGEIRRQKMLTKLRAERT